MAAVKTYEAECEETGNSKAALARLGMVRGILQPAFGALGPDRSVHAVCSETGMPSDVSRDCLGLFAIDGAAVACNALERVASDPGPPPADIAAALASYRLQRAAVELTEMNLLSLTDLLDDAQTRRNSGANGRRKRGTEVRVSVDVAGALEAHLAERERERSSSTLLGRRSTGMRSGPAV